jgi:hypothetical protein
VRLLGAINVGRERAASSQDYAREFAKRVERLYQDPRIQDGLGPAAAAALNRTHVVKVDASGNMGPGDPIDIARVTVGFVGAAAAGNLGPWFAKMGADMIVASWGELATLDENQRRDIIDAFVESGLLPSGSGQLLDRMTDMYQRLPPGQRKQLQQVATRVSGRAIRKVQVGRIRRKLGRGSGDI